MGALEQSSICQQNPRSMASRLSPSPIARIATSSAASYTQAATPLTVHVTCTLLSLSQLTLCSMFLSHTSARGTQSTLTGITPAFLWCKHWLNATQAFCTVMKNRLHLPDAIRDKMFRLADNEVVSFRNDRLLTVGWRAPQKKKPVIIVSSDGSTKPIEVHLRATGRLSSKPTVVDAYNQSMNGVDTADQFTVYYSFVCKSKKWWRKYFFGCSRS